MVLIKKFKDLAVTGLVALAIGLSSCGPDKNNHNNQLNTPNNPNPSAVYCEGLGYDYRTDSDPEGNQYGVCILPDNSECRTWQFFEGLCGQKYSYCELNNGTITTSNDCNTWFSNNRICAICTLSDGTTECYEWDYFKGACP